MKLEKNIKRYMRKEEFHNLLEKRKGISQQLKKESRLVREESIKIPAECN
ncbi:MAG: hypothetical protein ACTHK0_01380 [Ginsengibacter sp.]